MTFDAQFIEFDLILHPRFRRIIRHKNQLLPFGSKVRHCFMDTFENSVSFPDYTVAVEEEGIVGFEELHSIGVREDVCRHGWSDCEMAGSERGEGERKVEVGGKMQFRDLHLFSLFATSASLPVESIRYRSLAVL